MIETTKTITAKGTLMNWFFFFFFVKPNGKVSRGFKAALYASNNARKAWPAGTDIESKVFEMVDGKPVFIH